MIGTSYNLLPQDGADYAAELIARFRKIVILLFVMSVFALIVNVIEAIMYGGFGLVWVPGLYWVLIGCGYYGATRRTYTYVLAFYIGSFILLILTAIWICVAFYDISILAALQGICTGYNADCSVNITAVIALIVIALIFYCIQFVVLIYALILCHKLRPLIQRPGVVVTTQIVTQPVVTYQQPSYGTGPAPAYQQPPAYGQPQQTTY